MRDKDLYQKILGLAAPWYVADVDLNIKENSVKIIGHHELDALLSCPDCGDPCPLHDHKNLRHWRHLDTCQFKTVIES